MAGQEQVANILQQLSTNVQNLTIPRRANIDQDQEGRIHGEHHRYIAPARTFQRATRPTFVRNDTEEEKVEEGGEGNFGDNILAMHDEWDAMPPRVKDHLNFDRFMSQKREHTRNRNDRGPRYKHNDLWQATNKLTLANYDGSGRVTTRAWVSKLDTFLTLCPMPEEDSIRFAALHLDGMAHD